MSCRSCNARHWLSQCHKLKKMNVDQRYKFVLMKKLCLNCLTPDDFVTDCPKKSFCCIQDCPARHSTFLHLKTQANGDHHKRQPDDELKRNETSDKQETSNAESNNCYVTAMSSSANSPEGSTITGLVVVPVKVKAKGGDKTVETYAFLNTG